MCAKVNDDLCTGCGECVEGCPMEALSVVDEKAVVNEEECIECGGCELDCPNNAISIDCP